MNQQKKRQISRGICPNCGSDDLEYGAIEPEGEGIFYPYTCQGCGFDGDEYYDVSFTGHKNCKTCEFMSAAS